MKPERPITMAQFKTILGNDWIFFVEKIITNCWCPICLDEATIVDFKASVNDLNDVILRGKGAICGHSVNRYLETGENEECVKRINHLRKPRSTRKKRTTTPKP